MNSCFYEMYTVCNFNKFAMLSWSHQNKIWFKHSYININISSSHVRKHLVVTLSILISSESYLFCFGRKNLSLKKGKRKKNADKALSKQLLIMVHVFW